MTAITWHMNTNMQLWSTVDSANTCPPPSPDHQVTKHFPVLKLGLKKGKI